MLKLFKRIKYSMMSKMAERKLRKKYGCNASIKINLIKVQMPDGKIVNKLKTEITAYEKDYKKLMDVLLTKGQ